MKTIACTAFALTVFSCHAMGADLNTLIKQNVQDATRAYQKQRASTRATESIRLWIHVRKETQRKIAKKIQARLAKARPTDKIEEESIRLVHVGPSRTQLRYFKAEDKAQAKKLLEALRKMIPNIQLEDLSRDYARMTWIKRGHYELWLDPNLSRLKE